MPDCHRTAGHPPLWGADATTSGAADSAFDAVRKQHSFGKAVRHFATMESGSLSPDEAPPTPPGASVPDGHRQLLHSVSAGPRVPRPGQPDAGQPKQQNLMIVSNRLPVSVSRDPHTGEWALPMSPGGLVSALLGVSQVRAAEAPL